MNHEDPSNSHPNGHPTGSPNGHPDPAAKGVLEGVALAPRRLLAGRDNSEWRDFAVPPGHELVLHDANAQPPVFTIRTLDDLSETINWISPAAFNEYVNEERNDLARWVEDVWGEHELGGKMRQFPTPLRTMVAIEKFLRGRSAR
jgi:hypothetical protein